MHTEPQCPISHHLQGGAARSAQREHHVLGCVREARRVCCEERARFWGIGKNKSCSSLAASCPQNTRVCQDFCSGRAASDGVLLHFGRWPQCSTTPDGCSSQGCQKQALQCSWMCPPPQHCRGSPEGDACSWKPQNLNEENKVVIDSRTRLASKHSLWWMCKGTQVLTSWIPFVYPSLKAKKHGVLMIGTDLVATPGM